MKKRKFTYGGRRIAGQPRAIKLTMLAPGLHLAATREQDEAFHRQYHRRGWVFADEPYPGKE